MTKRSSILGYTGLLAFCLVALLCAAWAASIALYPSADGVTVYEDHGTTVDASHADQGYIMIKHTTSKKALKMRITKGDETYTYDLASDERYEAFALPFGSGKYKIQVFKQVSGKRYSNDSSISFEADIADSALPYLYPNQYVSYTQDSSAVKLADSLCEKLQTAQEKLLAIHTLVVQTILYDYTRASSVQSGYLPVIDDVLAQGKGICFDYAALTACMLRSQGVPTKLEIGYADKIYHAWNSVLIDGAWQRVDTTADANNMNVRTYTVERTY